MNDFLPNEHFKSQQKKICRKQSFNFNKDHICDDWDSIKMRSSPLIEHQRICSAGAFTNNKIVPQDSNAMWCYIQCYLYCILTYTVCLKDRNGKL